MYALLALLALGLLLAVHELGHLVAARLLGMRVPRFTFGFGPPMFSLRLLGTEFVLASVPLGATAHVLGMNPHAASAAEQEPGSYAAQRTWRRMVVVLAGPLANAALALGILFTLYVNGTHVVVPLTVGTVQPGSEAARAQLIPGDRIVRAGGQELRNWSAFVEVVADNPGRELTLDVLREGEANTAVVRPRPDERGLGRIGVSQQYVFRQHPPGEALGRALSHMQTVASELVQRLGRMVLGTRDSEGESPVALVRQSSDAASSGVDAFLRVLVTVSVALALLTSLPVPGLDGGRLVFLAVEAVRGQRPSPRAETLAHLLGFLGLTLAIVAVAVLDVRRVLPRPTSPPPARAAPAVKPVPDAGTPGGQAPPDAGRSTVDAGAPVPAADAG
ncbi:M50 family metallopeptidase [Myxococcaceae bacterium GXIMD 01537]